MNLPTIGRIRSYLATSATREVRHTVSVAAGLALSLLTSVPPAAPIIEEARLTAARPTFDGAFG
jgi:hypothetical protein